MQNLKQIITFVSKGFRNMNRRLQQFLSAENLSQAQFADAIGVARASISHILAGRNKPGFDFIEKIALAYPDLSLEWLILGKGKMYKRGGEDIFSQLPPEDPQQQNSNTGYQEAVIPLHSPIDEDAPEDVFPETGKSTGEEVDMAKPSLEMAEDYSSKNQKDIDRIVVFYTDNTFRELR